MAAPTPPSWLLPSISSSSRLGNRVPPTWHVVFICPQEDSERVVMMTKLSSVEEEWPDSPQVEMRRLVEVPWLMDWTPPTSVIFTMLKDDPLIFIDDQSRRDHTAIIVWKTKESSPEAARVPIGRANMLLGVAAPGGLSSDYARILPEPKGETASRTVIGVLPSHLSGLSLEPSTPTLISLLHLSETVQENLELVIGCRIIIHNWPENQEPCSRAQLYRMFQALKICHEGNDQAFALFIDDDAEGYHILGAAGSSVPNISDSDASKLELGILPFAKVGEFWNAAWNPESRIPTHMSRGPYRPNHAMAGLHVIGEPIVNPDDIPGSLGADVVFVLEAMTPTELRTIRTEMFSMTDENFMWVDVSDRLVSPDMQGLMAYFESEEFANHSPPHTFLAVDRKTLSDAMEPIDEREDWEAIIIASYEGGDVWFRDEMHHAYAHVSTGYGYDRKDFEEAEMAYINLKLANMSFGELCHGCPVVYWSAYRAWAEEYMGETFARSFGPGGMNLPRE